MVRPHVAYCDTALADMDPFLSIEIYAVRQLAGCSTARWVLASDWHYCDTSVCGLKLPVAVADEPAGQLGRWMIRVVRDCHPRVVADYSEHPTTELICRLVGDSNARPLTDVSHKSQTVARNYRVALHPANYRIVQIALVMNGYMSAGAESQYTCCRFHRLSVSLRTYSSLTSFHRLSPPPCYHHPYLNFYPHPPAQSSLLPTQRELAR